jgi:hypothetical protein
MPVHCFEVFEFKSRFEFNCLSVFKNRNPFLFNPLPLSHFWPVLFSSPTAEVRLCTQSFSRKPLHHPSHSSPASSPLPFNRARCSPAGRLPLSARCGPRSRRGRSLSLMGGGHPSSPPPAVSDSGSSPSPPAVRLVAPGPCARRYPPCPAYLRSTHAAPRRHRPKTLAYGAAAAS